VITKKRTLIIAAYLIVFLGVVFAFWIFVARPFIHRGRQVSNCANLWTFGRCLHEYKEKHGNYPARLADGIPLDWFDGRDSWGNDILYLSDGTSFVLVSCGSDGKPDGINYLAIHPSDRRPEEDCDDATVDQILTDTGWYRACGK
jgi:hypothetical protein